MRDVLSGHSSSHKISKLKVTVEYSFLVSSGIKRISTRPKTKWNIFPAHNVYSQIVKYTCNMFTNILQLQFNIDSIFSRSGASYQATTMQ